MLTAPDQLSKFFMGANVQSDFKEGSPITRKGEWKRKPYEEVNPDDVMNRAEHEQNWSMMLESLAKVLKG